MFNLSGKTALIIGGTGALGKSIAQVLGRKGAKVIITGMEDKQKAASIIEEFSEKKLDVMYEYLDISVIENIEEVVNKYSAIDILVNSAGINARHPIIDISEQEWDNVIDVNLKGVFFTSKIVAKQMLERKSGKIINLASLSSHIGLPNMGPYCASKGGINQLTKAMAIEWAPYIQVNAIAPGYFHTELTAPLFQNKEWTDRILSRIPTGRTGKPEDLNGVAVLLASSASDYITGQTIYVDGGWTAS